MNRIPTTALLLAGLVSAPAAAQSVSRPAPASPDTTTSAARSGFTTLRLAKWSSLAGATAAGIYGFIESGRADDRFNDLEALCDAQRVECALRTTDGAYQDPAFESLYQSVRRHDRRAHYALVAGQVGVATSVVLFLLDLGNARPPRDIPWVPRMERRGDEVRVGFRLPLGRRE